MKKKKMKNITVNLSDEVFLHLAKMAHKQDITFNELANNLLKEEMDKDLKGKK